MSLEVEYKTDKDLPKVKGFIVHMMKTPFWSIRISPNKNLHGLFDFSVSKLYDGAGYRCFLYKTSYCQNPVVSKNFKKDVKLEEIIEWIKDTLAYFKQNL